MPRPTRVHKRVNYQELDSEDEIHVQSAKRRVSAPQKTPQKRSKTAHRKTPTTAAEAGPGYVENKLFTALLHPESNVEEVSRQWLEQYEDTPAVAIADLVNLILRSCGCVTQVQEHDTETDAQSATVAEVVAAFSSQGYHEYPFGSKQQDRRFFRDNVVEFFEKVVMICHDKGMLDESAFMAHLLSWCCPFTACNIRPLRHMATVVVLAIQTSLCTVMSLIMPALEKTQRQLTNMANREGKRRAQAAVESLQFTARTYTAQKSTVEAMFLKITEAVLVHRYRDLDSQIRLECVRSLGAAIDTVPDYFFQPSYLRYLGWLLSDPVSAVRVEVMRILASLYDHAVTRNKTLDTGFRQFTERFKDQLMQMACGDDDTQVRLRATSVCCSLFTIGFLNNLECIHMGTKIVAYFTGSNEAADTRVKEKMVRFIDLIVTSKAEREVEKNKALVKACGDTFALAIAIKLKSIVEVFQSICNKTDMPAVSEIFAYLCNMTDAVAWSFGVDYFLMDTSALKVKGANTKKLQELVDISDRLSQLYISLYICSSILCLYKATLLRKLEKRPDILAEAVEETQIKLIELVPQLSKQFVKSSEQCGMFVKLWTLLLRPSPVFGSLFNGFKLIGQLHVYNDVNKDLLTFFDEYEPEDSHNDSALSSFAGFFSVLLLAYDAQLHDTSLELSQVLTPDVRIMVQNVTLSLATSSEQLLAQVEDAGFSLAEATTCVLKLYMLSEQIDIVSIIDGKVSAQALCLSVGKVLKSMSIQKEIMDESKTTIKYLAELKSVLYASLGFLSNITSILLESLIATSYHLDLTLDTDVLSTFEFLLPVLSTIVDVQEQARDAIFLVENLRDSNHSIPDRQKCLVSLTDVMTLIGAKVIDILIPIRLFYLKSKDAGYTNFEELFSYGQLGKYVTTHLDIVTEQGLLFPFLIHESRLAQLKGAEIKKLESESASIEEVAAAMVSLPEIEQTSIDLDDEDIDSDIREQVRENLTEQAYNRQKQELIWQCEKDLSVYALRLLALQKVALLAPDVVDRIGSNAEALGGAFGATLAEKEKRR